LPKSIRKLASSLQKSKSPKIAYRYKNFKCTLHNKFFELNLYQRDPVNRHHWRANIARPAADIDLDASSGGKVSAQRTASDDTEIEGPGTIRKNTSGESKVDSAKPATDLKEEDGEWDDYDRGGYDDEREDLDYTACSLECGYCGHCDY
jgi:hypothetical protein